MKDLHGVAKFMSKKFIALILILSMAMGVSGALASAAEQTNEDLSGKLVLVFTNDTHGADVAIPEESIGTAGVSKIAKDYKAAGAQVILISAGDAIQGDPLVNLSKGLTSINFMNYAGYDIMVPGNHEFDFGYDNLKKLEESADFTILSSNILDKDSGQPVFTENMIIDSQVGKIGIFGLTTPETYTKSNPKNVSSLNFLAGQELYENAQEQVDKLTEAGADYIICVAHLGIDDSSKPNRSVDVIENVKGIDLLIDGHSHSVLEGNKDHDTILVSTGTKLFNVGVAIIDKDKISTKLISASDYSEVDEMVNASINLVAAEIDELLSKTFAKTEVFLDGNRDPGVRTQETNLGDFVADAILWAANNGVGGGVDAALTNGGGIRSSIEIGDITMKDMKTVFPFGNTISTVKISGGQLIEVLEASTFSTPISIGAFPQVSGIEFTIDTSVDYKEGEAFPDSTYYGPAAPGSRIKNVKVNGKAIELDKIYTIATNDFLAAGGDTYYLLKSLESHNTYIALEDALVNYTIDVLDGVISGDIYGESAGRITISEEFILDKEEEVDETEDTRDITEEVVEEDQEAVVEVTYRVVKGDNLWKIARKHLGSGARYIEIYELNKDILESPDLIYIGQVIKIPA